MASIELSKKHDPEAWPITAPGRQYFAITPGAGYLTNMARAIWVDVTGSLVIVGPDDADQTTGTTFAHVPVGWWVGCASKVLAGSTATGLVGTP